MSTTRPLIAIPLFTTSKGAPARFVNRRYEDLVVAYDAEVIYLSQSMKEDTLQSILPIVTGVLFPGSMFDLDPFNDGFHRLNMDNILPYEDESFLRMLMSICSEFRIPVFGIGLGMQLVNVNQGGNLFLDLSLDKNGEIKHLDQHQKINHKHSIEVISDTLVGRCFGEGEILVNSCHRMAVDEVAPGFRATAFASDGVVEAMESEMPDWPVVCTQFHPEAATCSVLAGLIFERWLDSAISLRAV